MLDVVEIFRVDFLKGNFQGYSNFGNYLRNPDITKNGSYRKQPFRGVLDKRCSENMQQIYGRTPTPKCDLFCNFIEIALRHGASPINLLHIFRTPFPKNTAGGLLLSYDVSGALSIIYFRMRM